MQERIKAKLGVEFNIETCQLSWVCPAPGPEFQSQTFEIYNDMLFQNAIAVLQSPNIDSANSKELTLRLWSPKPNEALSQESSQHLTYPAVASQDTIMRTEENDVDQSAVEHANDVDLLARKDEEDSDVPATRNEEDNDTPATNDEGDGDRLATRDKEDSVESAAEDQEDIDTPLAEREKLDEQDKKQRNMDSDESDSDFMGSSDNGEDREQSNTPEPSARRDRVRDSDVRIEENDGDLDNKGVVVKITKLGLEDKEERRSSEN
jgi:hypothetical protein